MALSPSLYFDFVTLENLTTTLNYSCLILYARMTCRCAFNLYFGPLFLCYCTGTPFSIREYRADEIHSRLFHFMYCFIVLLKF